MSKPSASLRSLLHNAIDYAGLFPPARLDMMAAVNNYVEYVRSNDAWALGRFIVPASRLRELSDAVSTAWSGINQSVRLSVISTSDGDVDAIRAFAMNNSGGGSLPILVESVETKASESGQLARLAQGLATIPEVYVEIPIDTDPSDMLASIAQHNLHAKARTGGVTSDMFPSSANLARFMAACIAAGVPFKATAGLHHPIRSSYKLTYEKDAPVGVMFGFLNVLIAAAFAHLGMSEADLVQILEERAVGAFQFDDQGVRWRNKRVEVDVIARIRTDVLHSFGSCSFREPIDDLHSASLL